MTDPETFIVNVFPDGPGGGNPAPIVIDACELGAGEMKAIAARHGHESGFVFPPEDPAQAAMRLRFFVPNHEMEMCGHATIGALWVLRDRGRIAPGSLDIETLSGIVRAEVPAEGPISITQPVGTVKMLEANAADGILDVLGLSPSDLAYDRAMNAATSRVKTLVPIKSPERLHAITPDYTRIKALCDSVGSTGIYPFAACAEPGLFCARQFPRASGYPEDAATGIAASALGYGLLKLGLIREGNTIAVKQGEAMGRPSRISVTVSREGCLLSGSCHMAEASVAPGETT
jgi:PhzF family phenazine biosynthesis protein